MLNLASPPELFSQALAKRVAADERFRSRALQLLRDADVGITDLDIEELTSRVESSPDELRNAILAEMAPFLGDDQPIDRRIWALHKPPRTGETVRFSFEDDESNGTRRFFVVAGMVLAVFDVAGLLVVDELDCSLHPVLTRKVIELFQSPYANENQAQLLFATHDSTLIDLSLFRRDQIWLTDRGANGETQLYSLNDFEPLPEEGDKTELQYLSGRFGAVPRLGPTLEDLEIQ
jgi:hypothetical protein